MVVIAQYLTHKLIENQVIEKEDEEVYLYGIQLMLSSVLITICILTIGWLSGNLVLAICFMVALSQLRQDSGGYHANSYVQCFMLSCGTFILSMVMVYLQDLWHLKYSLIGCSLVAMYYLVRIGSLNSHKNPKTEGEMFYRKRRTRCLSILYTLISCSLFMFNQHLDIATILVCTQIYTMFAVWGLIKTKEEIK